MKIKGSELKQLIRECVCEVIDNNYKMSMYYQKKQVYEPAVRMLREKGYRVWDEQNQDGSYRSICANLPSGDYNTELQRLNMLCGYMNKYFGTTALTGVRFTSNDSGTSVRVNLPSYTHINQ